MPEIQFFDVTKIYNQTIFAVQNLNFTIYDGEYLSLLGPSGCGKTTALRLLSGLILPTKGRIEWDGTAIQDIGPDQREIGYVFQQFAIFPHLSVYDNIAFGPSVKGFTQKDTEDIVERYLSLVGLQEKANLMPKNLQAADLQRTGIARVLATGANTLLLDEPMGALDFKIREKFQDELKRLVKELKLTAIHVTHDQSEAMAISDRIGVMKKGKMIQLGSPLELLFNPREIFTSHFIGESNFFEGVVTEIATNHLRVEIIGDEVVEVPLKYPTPSIGARVVVGVRKEFFEIKPFEDSSVGDANILSGTVLSDRFLGEKRRTTVKLEYGRQIEVKSHPDRQAFSEGDRVTVKIPPNGSFLFKYPPEGLENALSVT